MSSSTRTSPLEALVLGKYHGSCAALHCYLCFIGHVCLLWHLESKSTSIWVSSTTLRLVFTVWTSSSLWDAQDNVLPRDAMLPLPSESDTVSQRRTLFSGSRTHMKVLCSWAERRRRIKMLMGSINTKNNCTQCSYSCIARCAHPS